MLSFEYRKGYNQALQDVDKALKSNFTALDNKLQSASAISIRQKFHYSQAKDLLQKIIDLVSSFNK